MGNRRRASGEGSVYFWEKKSLWVGKLTLPDGKRRTKYAKTQKEVKAWLLEERKKLQDGVYIADDKITVAGFMDRYIEDYCKRRLRETTIQSYTEVIRGHIIPELGDIRLVDLKPTHLNQLYSKKLDSGLSNRWVEYIHGVLKRSLNMAVKWGMLAKNPTLSATPPKVKSKTPKTWNSEQVKRFLEEVENDRWAGIYYIACGTGMRKGEIVGLPLSSLHLEEGYLQVTQTLQYVKGKGLIIQETKTDNSRRMIVLPAFVIDALKIHLAHREELSRGTHWQDSGLVFTTDVGTPISPRNLLRNFKEHLSKANLPDIRFHDLRHTTASLLLEKNVHPKLVSELLGHSSIQLTLSTYSHIINPMNRVVADTLDGIVK